MPKQNVSQVNKRSAKISDAGTIYAEASASERFLRDTRAQSTIVADGDDDHATSDKRDKSHDGKSAHAKQKGGRPQIKKEVTKHMVELKPKLTVKTTTSTTNAVKKEAQETENKEIAMIKVKNILAASEAQIADKTFSMPHHQLNIAYVAERDKRLCALTYHIENAQKRIPLLKPVEINLKEYRNLGSVDWTEHNSIVDQMRKIKASKTVAFPLKAGEGPANTLRYRWRLGADVGGSDLLLHILLIIRFTAGEETGGFDKAPKVVLSKIRATFYYFKQNYCSITEEDLEAIYQEIRAGQDPKLSASLADSRKDGDDVGNSGNLEAKIRQSHHAISKSQRGAERAAKKSSNASSLAAKVIKTSIWAMYLPSLERIKRYDQSRYTLLDLIEPVIAKENGTLLQRMWFARSVALDALYRLVTLHAPPSWSTTSHKQWVLQVKKWSLEHQNCLPGMPEIVSMDFSKIKAGDAGMTCAKMEQSKSGGVKAGKAKKAKEKDDGTRDQGRI